MKHNKHIATLLAAVLLAGGTMAAQGGQQDPRYLGGVVATAYGFGPYDMLTLSQHNTSLTTARASAMGGAFTSLGADLASMSVNPAGIAMYRSSTFGITPALNFSNSGNSYSDNSMDRSRFSFNNIGAVIDTYVSSRGLTNVNFGFSYNKLADFNNSYEASMGSGPYSIADIFAQQLSGMGNYLYGGSYTGKELGWLRDPFYNENIYLDEWGAALGYQTGIVSPVSPNDATQTLYTRKGIDSRASIIPRMEVENRGSVGEYNFTVGMNFGNKFYLGLGLTAQSIYLSRNVYYSEEYANNIGDSPTDNLKNLYYTQNVVMSGAGFNFKIGAIYRPIPGLRIGVAVHTPTWTSLDHEYSANMKAYYLQSSGSKTGQTLLNTYGVDYTSPARLMAGVSYAWGNYAVFAVDYERVWYNGMRYNSDDHYANEDYKAYIKNNFSATDNLKVGLEVKPVQTIALRAGYSFHTSPVDLAYRDPQPVISETHNISAGVGFRIGVRTSLDFAYVYSSNKYSVSDTFFYEGMYLDANGNNLHTDDTGFITTGNSPLNDLKINRHTAIMSLSFLF